jgi:hypothetical protein
VLTFCSDVRVHVWIRVACARHSGQQGSFFVVRKHGDAEHKLPKKGDRSINWQVYAPHMHKRFALPCVCVCACESAELTQLGSLGPV